MPPLLLLRRYRPSDRATCMALFEGNIPGSFLTEEIPQFARFLDDAPGPYFLAEDEEGRALACGGLARRDDAAVLCWGLVDAGRHRQGIGRVLLRLRLAIAARKEGIMRVVMDTSQVMAPFFLREGFITLREIPNYFRVGLDRHDLELPLDDKMRRGIEARLAATLAEGHQLEEGIADTPW